ncbi:hypothetical protein IQ244_29615 [Nostoc sp. LEGE 06077]|nr:hypothetical protein [Nostoc sp. LEGE 06077]MBE9210587.1 hypothetical protein [Nostoc sp. LEGE 06077]
MAGAVDEYLANHRECCVVCKVAANIVWLSDLHACCLQGAVVSSSKELS